MGNPAQAARRAAPPKDSADLLTVSAEWLRRALWRSFLRYNVTADLDAAVHAAMNVIQPVLDARDTELLRLHALTPVTAPAKAPVKATAKVAAGARVR